MKRKQATQKQKKSQKQKKVQTKAQSQDSNDFNRLLEAVSYLTVFKISYLTHSKVDSMRTMLASQLVEASARLCQQGVQLNATQPGEIKKLAEAITKLAEATNANMDNSAARVNISEVTNTEQHCNYFTKSVRKFNLELCG
jgi:hypothetical protein